MLPSLLLLSALLQPTPPPRLSTPTTSLEPAIAWSEVVSAYRAGPIHERLAVIVKTPADRPAPAPAPPPPRADFIFRSSPAAEGQPAAFALELGSLRLYASAGFLVITDTTAPTTFFRCDYDPPLTLAHLSDCLPPLPILPLAIINDLGPNVIPRDLTPYHRAVTWRSATADERPGRRYVDFQGDNPDGPVELVVDLQTLRVRSLKGRVLPEGFSVELLCTAIDPTAPLTWSPNLDTRRLVATLAELRD